MCDNQVCRATLEGNILYVDKGHFSHEGSRYLGNKIDMIKLFND